MHIPVMSHPPEILDIYGSPQEDKLLNKKKNMKKDYTWEIFNAHLPKMS